jgi:hypothetical protein
MNGSDTDTPVSVPTFTTIDEKNSITTIGARLDGHADNKEVANNHFEGFIYSLRIDSQALAINPMKNSRVTSGCGSGCTSCPSETNSCLWNCDEDKYYDTSSSSC